MSVLLILILASLGMALGFLGCFIWAVRSGQFEDTCTPSMRILTDDARGAVASGQRAKDAASVNDFATGGGTPLELAGGDARVTEQSKENQP